MVQCASPQGTFLTCFGHMLDCVAIGWHLPFSFFRTLGSLAQSGRGFISQISIRFIVDCLPLLADDGPVDVHVPV